MAGAFTDVQPQRSPGRLSVTRNGDYSEFTLPQLSDYELVVVK